MFFGSSSHFSRLTSHFFPLLARGETLARFRRILVAMGGVLEVRDIHVSYGATEALRGVSFEAREGAVGLLGPNGAGKSTLIMTLLNLVPLSSGSFTLFGEQSGKLGAKLRDSVGYVPESQGIRSGMSGVAWVALLGEVSGLPRQAAVERAHETLQYVGLGESRYREAQTYSTGMQQRLKLAAALVHDPKLVLLDEPTAGMDPTGREEMLGLCRDLVKQGKTLLFSTHILKDVEAVCSQVVILHKGRVAASAGLSDLTRSREHHFLVQWDGDRGQFMAACEKAGWKAGDGQNNLVKVVLPENTNHRELFALASRLGGSIHRFVREETSLEEVFLEALAKEAQNAGV